MSTLSGISSRPVARDSSTSLSAADDQDISGLLQGSAWNATSLTFSFPTSSDQYGTQATYGDNDPFNGFSALDSAGHSGQQAEAARALNLISSYTNLTFTQITETTTTHATIRFANTAPSSISTGTSEAYYPSTNIAGGDIFYGGTGENPRMGNFDSGQAILHELGHALGLKHGQDNFEYGTMNADRLDIEFSLMNYPNYIGSNDGFATASTSSQTYMMYDIAALQYMYGANFNMSGQNNTYSWSASTGEEFVNGASQGRPVDNHIFETIWDGGSVSTYDLSNFSQSQVDDMRPGYWMLFSSSQLADLNANAASKPSGEIFARADIYNALEYNGDARSLIDNIITGSGNDTITENAANNTINGGAGTDTVIFAGIRAAYTITALASNEIQVVGPDGTDTLFNIERLTFSDTTLTGPFFNQAPVLNAGGGSLAYTENQVPTAIDTAITVSDADNANLAGATVSITNNFAAGQDILAFVNQNGITGSYNAATGTLTLSGTSSVANYQAALRSVTYYNNSDNPYTPTRTISFLVDDGQGTNHASNVVTAAVTVTPVNDAPTDINAITLLAVNENAPNGTVAGAVLAKDVDNASFTYSLLNDAGGRFTIDNNGIITVAYGLLLDYEQSSLYVIRVQAKDAGGLSVIKDFGITINDVNPDNVTGDANSNTIVGGAGDDNINGAGGNDRLVGNGGNDVLDGGAGADVMIGGLGNDIYIVDNVADQVTENANEGRDTVYTSVNYTLPANVEVLVSQGTADLQINGNALDNTIYGNSGNNVIDGGAGADVMIGGAGNDSYIVDNAGDQVIENPGEGRDTVYTSINYTLTANVEVLVAQGTADLQINGNALDNTIFGNSGNNVIDGGAGADIMIGGAGNDSYVVDNVSDQVVENANEGRDTIFTTVNYTLPANVEVMLALGTADLQINGNALANTITGNSGSNIIDGGASADIMIGGLGDDSYVVDNVSDQVVENLNEGRDTIYTTVNYTLPANVEVMIAQGTADLQINGNALDNTIWGNSGNNIIDGGAGVDRMIGGLGNDSYVVDNVADQVIENPGEGRDTVYTTINYTLAANLEVLIAQGLSDLQINGNSLDNTIWGNSGSNIIDGGAGADVMMGGLGNDSYIVDNPGDQVVENANEGRDTVYTTINHTLEANVEVMVALGIGDLQINGNALANTIWGNVGNNIIDGGAGADILIGGLGDDSYVVDNVADQVVENANEGHDTIYTTVNYTLSANVEVMVAQGGADLQINGNSLDNTVIGNSGNNIIDGGAGVDTMIGGLGDDSYVVDNVADQVIENAGEGRDTIYTTVNYTLPGNVEVLIAQGNGDLQINGNGLDNTVIGNSGNNIIDGGAGADTMVGGLGDDSYVVDNVADQVIENVNEGRDTIYTTVNYTLPSNVEVLVAQGSADLQITGNGLANTMIGNSGSNVIDGGAGADILVGNGGNDVFVFRSGQAAGDTIQDFAGNGAAAGDMLEFAGFGTAAQGATFTQLNATQWQIHSGLDAHNEIITLSNGATVHPTDILFV